MAAIDIFGVAVAVRLEVRMVIKTGLGAFSQQKIYPGHGKLFIKVQDSKVCPLCS